MARAAVLVLQRPPYYGDLMMAALQRMGYEVTDRPFGGVRPEDVMVTWNRHAARDGPVREHEAAGGAVVVVENGYFGRNFRGREWFAMSRGHHNGAGWWPEGDESRWDSLGLTLSPWKVDGSEIVVLASRGMGSEKCREPRGWSEKIAEVARRETGRRVRVRRHPGPQAQCRTDALEVDLSDAWAAITWGSSAALKALVAGVPVFHGFRHWIGRDAARSVSDGFSERFLGDRLPMFRRLAWAMWTKEEIESGEPFRCLLT